MTKVYNPQTPIVRAIGLLHEKLLEPGSSHQRSKELRASEPTSAQAVY